jgi:hypothetical protein
MYDKIVDEEFYDIISIPFYQETSGYGSNNYTPINKRRPSNKFNMCKKIVEDSTALLFGDAHFPAPHTSDVKTRQALQMLVKECRLQSVFLEAALWGSVGSVALFVGIINKQLFCRAVKSIYLTPIFENEWTRNLVKVVQKYSIAGSVLVSMGYKNIKENELYWFQRVWDTERDIYYKPMLRADYEEDKNFIEDAERTVTHGFGFVPIVWVKNLPGGNLIDGACTFKPSIDLMISRDYQTSQGDRGLRYSSDPTLVLKQPLNVAGEKKIIGADRALMVPPDGDAKLLEISGAAAGAVNESAKMLRENGLEVSHGNRADTSKLSVAQSGKAMEMMNQDLVWVAEKLRTQYGLALLDALYMMLRIAEESAIVFRADKKLPTPDLSEDISLVWEPWYPLTPDDMQKTGLGISALIQSKVISRRTATRELAATFDIEDVDEEQALIKKEESSFQTEKTPVVGAFKQTNEVTNAETK